MKSITYYRLSRIILVLFWVISTVSSVNSYAAEEAIELIIINGRVIDPETGLDAIRDVAVSGGRIVSIVEPPYVVSDDSVLKVDAQGMVVAPGFVDLHVHGQSEQAHEYQARDGVTTALELEWGYAEVGSFLDSRRGRSRVNYGASASHGMLRALALTENAGEREILRSQLAGAVRSEKPLGEAQALVVQTYYTPLPPEKEQLLRDEIERALNEGAIGIGMPHAYYPGADNAEIYNLFEVAADLDVPIFTHVRGRGLPRSGKDGDLRRAYGAWQRLLCQRRAAVTDDPA